MENPFELIKVVAARTDRVFLWTHYFDPNVPVVPGRHSNDAFSISGLSLPWLRTTAVTGMALASPRLRCAGQALLQPTRSRDDNDKLLTRSEMARTKVFHWGTLSKEPNGG